jgi:copper transport protein
MVGRLAAAALILLLWCVGANAHATLVRSDPADGAMLDAAPARVVLTFNEAVSPLVLRLVAANGTGTEIDRFTVEAERVTAELPAGLGDGGYVLSWRVVSTDGHPIGGSVVFSVGAGMAAPPGAEAVESLGGREVAIVAVRALVYAGLFLGIGGLFFAAFVGPPGAGAIRAMVVALATTPPALALSVGLQGLDALGLPVADLWRPEPWRAGFATSYGTAAVLAIIATLAALVGLGTGGNVRRVLSALGLAMLGVAFAATGHASAASPEWLTRPLVFVHVVGVAVWAGALVPLALLLFGPDAPLRTGLGRFSAIIPYAVVPLTAAGIVLAVIQVASPSALVSTDYGFVLLGKLALLVPLFALAALNRMRLTRPALAGGEMPTRRLAATVGAELVLVAAILAVVALWRFTPPPRSLLTAAPPPAMVHVHGEKGSAMITITPGRVGPVSVAVTLGMPGAARLEAKEVTVTLLNPAAGIEPIRRKMTLAGGTWTAEGITLPVPGAWTVRTAALVTDYDKVTLEGIVEIAP